MKGRWSGVALALGLVGLAVPAAASAGAQIGATFAPDSDCGEQPVTVFQTTSPGEQYAAPSSGVITSWSFQAGPVAPQQLKFKVGRAAGDNSFTVVGESAVESPAANAPNSFPTRISIEAGDVIGFFILGVDPQCGRIDMPGYGIHSVLGDPDPGTTATYMPGPSEDRQVDVSAILEPDCDADGFGDETQDPTPACPRTLTFDANKNKVKKGKQVRFSGQIVATRQSGSCAANQSVQLQRKKPRKSTFRTVGQLQTDAAGAFSAKKKVKKTFQYRVLAPETATCAGQTSNIERVKVKKKR